MSDFEQKIANIREAAAGIKRTLDEVTVMSTQKAEQTERKLLVTWADFFDALATSAQQLLA